MNMALLAAYMLAVLLLLATPGPVVALVMGTAAREGSRRAFMTVLGTNSASLMLMVLAALMLLGVVALSPVMLSLLGVLGSLYIGWSAVSSLMHKAQGVEAVPEGLSGRYFKPKGHSLFCRLLPAVYCHHGRLYPEHADALAGVGGV